MNIHVHLYHTGRIKSRSEKFLNETTTIVWGHFDSLRQLGVDSNQHPNSTIRLSGKHLSLIAKIERLTQKLTTRSWRNVCSKSRASWSTWCKCKCVYSSICLSSSKIKVAYTRCTRGSKIKPIVCCYWSKLWTSCSSCKGKKKEEQLFQLTSTCHHACTHHRQQQQQQQQQPPDGWNCVWTNNQNDLPPPSVWHKDINISTPYLYTIRHMTPQNYHKKTFRISGFQTMYCIHTNQAINRSSKQSIKEIQIACKLGSKSRNLASHQISYITTHFIPDDAKRLVALLLPSASIVSSDAVEVELGVDPNINGCQSNKRDERCKCFHSKKRLLLKN